jgi:iron complex outermembrane receptor protein
MFKVLLTLLVSAFLSVDAFAQQITVKGLVKDGTGEPVIGANVLVKGTTNGTITDFDGNFQLTANQGDIIVVSFIGFTPQELPAAAQMNIILKDDTEMMEEVVVIGYGVAKKNDLTGSVTAIKPDKMNKGLVTNAQDMMAGKIAGVSVISDGGTPGGSATIRIRGGSSLSADNDPLIVIDGLAMDNNGVKGLANPLSMVNPNDIETFTVLKDASATAIYGSRASNGVIIITTKKGTANSKPRISYDGNVSLSNVKETLDVMNGDEYRAFIEEIWGGQDNDAYRKLGTANTDWQDEIYRSAVSTDHNLTISGGLKNMPYRLSLGYTNQNGIIKTSNFERYTASLNLAPSFLEDHLKVNANLKAMYAKNRYADGGVIGTAASYDPTQPVYSNNEVHQKYFGGYSQWYIDGSSLGDSSWEYYKNGQAAYNPVATLNQKDDQATSKSLVGNMELDYKIHGFEDLRLHMSAGMDLSTGRQETIWSPYSGQNNYYGNVGFDETDKYNLSLNMYAQYYKDFNEKHHFDIMGGYEWQHFHREGNSYYAGTYPSTSTKFDTVTGESLAGKPYSPSVNKWATENFLVSFFGRANYTFLDRYMLTATVRYDGSSRFSKDNRWAIFPSFAFGWRMKEEAFLKDIEWLSDMKLRLGYGITGQQNISKSDYPTLATFVENKDYAYYPILGNGTTFRPSEYNTDLKWEETTTYNVGLDLGFLNGRFTAAVDYYFRKTDDLINSVYVAAGTNFKNKVLSNIGSLENSGIEFSTTARVIEERDWRWELGYNVTYNKNEITKLTSGDGEGYYVPTGGISSGTGNTIQAHAVGHPASSFYVYQQVYDENGKPLENEFVDRDGNGIINDKDRYFYKKPTADVLMGLTSKLIYKNWDFNFSLRASFNNYVYNDVEAGNSNCKSTVVYSFDALNNRPKMVLDNNFQGIGNFYMSDYYVQNASFLKCDNITLGYSFDKIFGKEISGRIYGTVQNVFTISDYKGLDPEINGGIDNSIYPRPLTSIIGLSLNF